MRGNFSYFDMFQEEKNKDRFIELLDALEADGKGMTRKFQWVLGDWTDDIKLQEVTFQYSEDITLYSVLVGYNIAADYFFIRTEYGPEFISETVETVVKEVKKEWRELALYHEMVSEQRDKAREYAEDMAAEENNDGQLEED